MICPKCGKETKDDGVFCINCGCNMREYTEQMQANNANSAVYTAQMNNNMETGVYGNTSTTNNTVDPYGQTTVLNNNTVSLDKNDTNVNNEQMTDNTVNMGFAQATDNFSNANNNFASNNFSNNNNFNNNNFNNNFNNGYNNNFNNAYANNNFNGAQQNMYAAPSLTDHTSEFDQKDIQDNKLIAMVAYMFGIVGILIASLINKDSEFVKFHVKQAIKIEIVTYISALCGIVGIIPILGWIIAFVLVLFQLVLFVVTLIQFFDASKGNAKEAPIVSSFGFLK